MDLAFALSPRHVCSGPPTPVILATGRAEGRVPQEEVWEVLLARANDGDGTAFARFLHAVTPTLRAVIRRRGDGLPPDQHEDILQEVLLAIHLKRQTWRRDEPRRVCRRLIVVSYAAMGSVSRAA